MTAKLDTGAETASISAKDILIYELNGQEYASFTVAHPELEQPVHYNLPIVQHVKIKKRASEHTQKTNVIPTRSSTCKFSLMASLTPLGST